MIRVSTQKQGTSGLGLEAQRDAVARFAEAERCDVVDTFTEVETGKGADALEQRPQLAAALKAARKLKCPIVVSKDRRGPERAGLVRRAGGSGTRPRFAT